MRKRLVGVVVAAALSVGGFVINTPPAAALDNVVCNAAGNVFVTKLADGRIRLRVSGGIGRCNAGDAQGPYVGRFSGTGTAGPFANPCGGGILPVTNNLRIPITLTMESVTVPGRVLTRNIVWVLPLTTFPLIQEFAVVKAGAVRGAGVISTTRTLCQGDLNSSGALFDFDFIDQL